MTSDDVTLSLGCLTNPLPASVMSQNIMTLSAFKKSDGLSTELLTLCLDLRADEENITSSSEDEEEERKRQSDELLGQICSIENVEESINWFIALVSTI